MWLQFFAGGGEFCLQTMLEALRKRYPATEKDGVILIGTTAVYLHFNPAPLSIGRFFEIFSNARADAGIKRVVILTATHPE